MSEVITIVNDFPININVIDSPIIDITTNVAGVQGPIGTAGTGGGGITGSFYPLSNPNAFSTSGDLYNTGHILINLINAASAGVSSINLQSGILDFTGAGNISVITNGQNFIFSGANVNSNASMVTGISILGSNNHLTGYVTFSAGDNNIQLGQSSDGIIILSPGIQQTGSYLYNLITGVSGSFNTSEYISTGQIIRYNKFLTSGVETEFITFPFTFSQKPTTVTYDFENNRDLIIYNLNSSGITSSGFFINYSDFLSNSGYILDINVMI